MSHFKIYKRKDGCYSILFKVNNRIEFFGNTHKTKNDCYRAIKLIRHLSFIDKAINIKRTPCGSWVFYLINLSNGERIEESQTYINRDELISRLSKFKSMLPASKVDCEIYAL